MLILRLILVGSVLAACQLSGCSAPRISTVAPQPPSPEERARLFARVDSVILASIDEGVFPGAALAIGRRGELYKLDGYGTYTYESKRPTTPQSVFDLASLTKVIATTTATMLLYEEDLIDLEATVQSYLPAFNDPEKADITIWHLLTHTSGLIPFRFFYEDSIFASQAIIDSIYTMPLQAEPGERYRYSDFSMITLLHVLESIVDQDFGTFADERIFKPLGMAATGFRGTGDPDTTVVPTELDDYYRNRLVQGEVHDETAWLLGGTAGHAGLFSSAQDVATFAGMMAQFGRYEGGLFLSPETVHYFTTVVDITLSSRALGWDTKRRDGKPSSAGAYFGPRSFGHTGFTGTSMWIDPDTGVYVVLLTNRVYPTRENYGIGEVRGKVADLAHEALVGL